MKKYFVLLVGLGVFFNIGQAKEDKSYFKRWQARQSSFSKRFLLYVPRLFKRSGEILFTGKTIQQIGHTIPSVEGVLDKENKACPLLSEGMLNWMKVFGNITSDVAGMIKQFDHSRFDMTHRLKVCEHSLMRLSSSYGYLKDNKRDLKTSLSNPSSHILMKIDDIWVYEWDGERIPQWSYKRPLYHENLTCLPTLLKKNESTSLAIQRLKCLEKEFVLKEEQYGRYSYNCGGFVEDVYTLAGLGIPGISNFGIGSNFKKTYKVREKFKKAKKTCDEKIAWIQKTMGDIGSVDDPGDIKNIHEVLRALLAESSLDLFLEILGLGAKHEKLRPHLTELLKDETFEIPVKDTLKRSSFYFSFIKGRGSAANERHQLLKKIFKNIDDEGKEWVKNFFPNLFLLIKFFE